MYSVRLRSGARHGETPRIGGNPKNQPISELDFILFYLLIFEGFPNRVLIYPDIFSKRQALSRAVVVNSNMSRGKYLARGRAWFEARVPQAGPPDLSFWSFFFNLVDREASIILRGLLTIARVKLEVCRTESGAKTKLMLVEKALFSGGS